MQLTTNFKKSEFDSKDGATMPSSVLANIKILAQNLQVLREVLNKEIHINSGYRSASYNAKIDGAKNSQHLVGKAADISVKGVSPQQVYQTIEQLILQGKMRQGGLGLYENFVHYDFRGKKVRWDYRAIAQKKK